MPDTKQSFINTMGVKIFKWEQHLVGFLANLEEINSKKSVKSSEEEGERRD